MKKIIIGILVLAPIVNATELPRGYRCSNEKKGIDVLATLIKPSTGKTVKKGTLEISINGSTKTYSVGVGGMWSTKNQPDVDKITFIKGRVELDLKRYSKSRITGKLYAPEIDGELSVKCTEIL